MCTCKMNRETTPAPVLRKSVANQFLSFAWQPWNRFCSCNFLLNDLDFLLDYFDLILCSSTPHGRIPYKTSNIVNHTARNKVSWCAKGLCGGFLMELQTKPYCRVYEMVLPLNILRHDHITVLTQIRAYLWPVGLREDVTGVSGTAWHRYASLPVCFSMDPTALKLDRAQHNSCFQQAKVFNGLHLTSQRISS